MEYTTQMDAARKGIVTKEIETVAKKEKMEIVGKEKDKEEIFKAKDGA